MAEDKDNNEPHDDFEQEANRAPSNIIVEFKDFLLYNKKWWLLPIVIVLLLAAGLVLLAGSPLAPLIYTIF
jgi:hypothetical protein